MGLVELTGAEVFNIPSDGYRIILTEGRVSAALVHAARLVGGHPHAGKPDVYGWVWLIEGHNGWKAQIHTNGVNATSWRRAQMCLGLLGRRERPAVAGMCGAGGHEQKCREQGRPPIGTKHAISHLWSSLIW
jgi:hypothetical protein